MLYQARDRGDGVYRLEGPTALLGVVGHELPLSVPPVDGGEPSGSFGWVSGVCEAPNRADRYIVEFLGKREFRILAYIDRYGRAFTTGSPVTMPPARHPDLDFARFSVQPDPEEERGCVEVHDSTGRRQVARFVCKHGRYDLRDSWYDFGAYATGLSYSDAIARSYLAFVHRPAQGAVPVPASGLGEVGRGLVGAHPLAAMRQAISLVESAEGDPALRPPALLDCFCRWLLEAGFKEFDERGLPDEALGISRGTRYADVFRISAGEDADGEGLVPRRQVWALESALNRFLLASKTLDAEASGASARECALCDERILETAGGGPLDFEPAEGAPRGAEGGEWELRDAICAALERLPLPIRMEFELRLDAEAGLAAFEIVAPDAGLMPASRWRDAQADGEKDGYAPATQKEREAQALRYAMHLGLAAARAAFEASPAIERVELTVRPFRDAGGAEGRGDARGDEAAGRRDVLRSFYRVSIRREELSDETVLAAAQTGDPTFLFVHAGAKFGVLVADPFSALSTLDSAEERRSLPESLDAELPAACARALCSPDAAGMRIDAEAYRRALAERLAERIARSTSTTEAIRLLREEQNAALARGDAAGADACTRLMSALAEGSVDAKDENALVDSFLGEDRCLDALERARAMAKADPEGAVDLLVDAVAEASALDGFVDGKRTAFRYFDSYSSRLCYNRALARARGRDGSSEQEDSLAHANIPCLDSVAAADAGRELSLVHDSFYLCHLQIVHLLEHSFERSDEALRYGRRAIELGPSTVAGYRQLGRAFMLVGDMENAATALRQGLQVAVQPKDLAVAYYQLAYVLWKQGDEKAACACYLKSIDASPVVAVQASAELHELLGQSREKLPLKGQIDLSLEDCGVPVAPSAAMLDILEEGAVAAVDAGLFPVARNLLALRLHYRPDEALLDLLHSLEDLPES